VLILGSSFLDWQIWLAQPLVLQSASVAQDPFVELPQKPGFGELAVFSGGGVELQLNKRRKIPKRFTFFMRSS
jgi:hypothetical protein